MRRYANVHGYVYGYVSGRGGTLPGTYCRRMIDRGSGEPAYLQLADLLAAMIESGELPVGRTIPSEKTLEERYGVGRGTARKGVTALRERGLGGTDAQRGAVGLPWT